VRRITLASLAWDGATWVEPVLKHLPRNERETYFFAWPPSAGDSRGAAGPTDPGARLTVLNRTNAQVPDAFKSVHDFSRMYAVAFTCEDGWRGRLFVLDPKYEARPSFVQGFERTLNHLLPAAVGIGDLHALRRRAAAQERVRLARELHDGVLQELLNVDVEIELLRRRPDADWVTVREQLGGVQQQLREQVSGLRTLLQQARSHDGSTSKLPALLANVVQRFGREHGINAEYKASIAQLRLPSRVSSEMVRIVQEALVNVRRHSGACHVVVTLDRTADQLILGIQDDGRGFPIAMPAPSIVDDRVQGIGGTVTVLAVERGARLEVRLPRNGTWSKCKKPELSSPTITRYSETG
jgi:signal transduction histidine kinase